MHGESWVNMKKCKKKLRKKNSPKNWSEGPPVSELKLALRPSIAQRQTWPPCPWDGDADDC